MEGLTSTVYSGVDCRVPWPTVRRVTSWGRHGVTDFPVVYMRWQKPESFTTQRKLGDHFEQREGWNYSAHLIGELLVPDCGELTCPLRTGVAWSVSVCMSLLRPILGREDLQLINDLTWHPRGSDFWKLTQSRLRRRCCTVRIELLTHSMSFCARPKPIASTITSAVLSSLRLTPAHLFCNHTCIPKPYGRNNSQSMDRRYFKRSW